MRTTVDVYGLRVRQARVMRRMTATAATSEMGWKSPRLNRLEQAAATAVEADDFDRLVEVFRFPPKFFTTAPTSRVLPTDLLFRAPRSITATEKEYLAQFAALAGEFLDELSARHQLPALKLPQVRRGRSVIEAAAEVRRGWGLAPDEPIEYLTHAIESAGVPIIVRRELTSSSTRGFDPDSPGNLDKHLGYSTRVGEFNARPLIIVRQSDSWERTRWTVAHEIGHLTLHFGGDLTEDMEDEASRFASELLAPSASLAREVPRNPSLVELLEVKAHWGISLGALLRHLFESELLSGARYEALRRQLYTRINPDTGRTWGRTEPGWDDRVVERPRLLSKWLDLAFSVSSAQMLVAYDLMWPQDMLEDFLAWQRPAPSPANRTTVPARGDADVIDFARFRPGRRA